MNKIPSGLENGDKPTMMHGWPFEYDPTPLGPGESRVIVRGKRPEPESFYEPKREAA